MEAILLLIFVSAAAQQTIGISVNLKIRKMLNCYSFIVSGGPSKPLDR
jgi:hypothetical protein